MPAEATVLVPYHTDGQATLFLGDARAVLVQLPAESVACAVTSPPYYSLRDYGIPPSIWGGDNPDCAHEWGEDVRPGNYNWAEYIKADGNLDKGHQKAVNANRSQFCHHCGAWLGCLGLEPDVDLFVSHLVDVFREVRRVLHPSGTLWVNIGDSYAGSGGAGGDYAEGGLRDGQPRYKGTAYRGQNVPQTKNPRVDYPETSPHRMRQPGLKPKDLMMVPARFALAMQADGWWLRSEITLCKVAPMPESVTDRPTSATEKLYLFAKAATYYYDAEALREPALHEGRVVKAYQNGAKNLTGATEANDRRTAAGFGSHDTVVAGRNVRNWWEWRPEPYAGQHFATFPSSIPKRCILAGTSERGVCGECGAPWERVMELTPNPSRVANTGADLSGGAARTANPQTSAGLHRNNGKANGTPPITTGWRPACAHDAPVVPAVVLDPFVGAGTTVLAAKALGRYGWGIDLSPAYLDLAIARTRQLALGLEAR